MLTPRSILRHIQQGRSQALLRALAANDAPLCPPAMVEALSGSSAAATALGLRRLVELSRQIDSETQSVLDDVLARQREDGSVESDLLATAAAVGAWSTILEEPWSWPAEAMERVRGAREGACRWLARQWESGSGEEWAVRWAWILLLLVGDEAFGQALPVRRLAARIEQFRDRMDPDARMVLDLALAGPSANVNWAESPLAAA